MAEQQGHKHRSCKAKRRCHVRPGHIIEVDGRRLVVSGERVQPERKGRLRRQARVWGSIAFEVILPVEVDEEHVEASMNDGVLHVRVPKSTGRGRRRIDVT